MRLKPFEIETIKSCLKESFGENAKIYLFGSRTDDAKRGGDIDLYVVAEPLPADWSERRSALWICLQERLGEQKIDILISRNPDEPIERIARKEGIQL
jgi:predicted nucleotidyltransferase